MCYSAILLSGRAQAVPGSGESFVPSPVSIGRSQERQSEVKTSLPRFETSGYGQTRNALQRRVKAITNGRAYGHEQPHTRRAEQRPLGTHDRRDLSNQVPNAGAGKTVSGAPRARNFNMARKLLIDAAHPEETRVAAVDDEKVVGFEFESRNRKQISGNIYLARVVRIEAALQAVFVEYGGNRHGFLAFPEIHQDYFNIPVSDKRRQKTEDDDIDGSSADAGGPAGDADSDQSGTDSGNETQETPADASGSGDNPAANSAAAADSESETGSPDSETETGASAVSSGDDRRNRRQRRKYRVQEVIRKGQILLVQVLKEERGGKGAALTTFISLAGRYCVFMPNSDRCGGISRKITNVSDRSKLKQIATNIEVPNEAGLIIRTAGAHRTKQEIRRDYDFLIRQWNEIRNLTLKSIAPAKIYEEGDLIRRTIRDDYSKGMDEIIVQGGDGYRTAKNFMKMIMPSHAKKVKQYSGGIPIFTRYNVENELNGLFDPLVHLKSGGYIVIGQTEALVAIDVNSGRATRAGTLEQTALQTNLEAAETVAAQLRLRDLAGLIVIDFIDMEESKSNQLVEKRLKDCLKSDRSKVQIGQITNFGLLEMSRQRLKPGIMDMAASECARCNGVGRVRDTESLAIDVHRRIEVEAEKGQQNVIQATVPLRIANFLLNHKRSSIQEAEATHGVSIMIEGVAGLQDYELEIRRMQRSVTEAGEEQEQVVGIETPFRVDRPHQRAGEKRGDGIRRRRKRGPRGGAGQRQADTHGAEQADAAAAEPEQQTEARGGKSRRGKAEGDQPDRKSQKRSRKRSSGGGVKQRAQDDSEDTLAETGQPPAEPESPKKSRACSARRPRRKASAAKPKTAAAPVADEAAAAENPDPPAAARAPSGGEAEPQSAAAAEPASASRPPKNDGKSESAGETERKTGWWSDDYQQEKL